MAMTQQEIIKKFMVALDTTNLSGKNALDAAIAACSSFKDSDELIAQLLADQKKAGSGDKFLKNYCGINLSNTDTGAITGKDAGGKTTKTAASVVPESGTTWKYPSGTSFTKRGLTVIIPAESTIVDDNIGTAAVKKKIISGAYTWWIDAGLKLIEESLGYSFSDSDTKTKKITLNFVNDSNQDWLAWIDYGNINNLSLNINLYHYEKIDASNVNGKATEGTDWGKNHFLDRTIAHELVHAIMAAKIDNYGSLPLFLREGLAELVHGIDDERVASITELSWKYKEDLAEFLNPNKNMSGWGYEYSSGYMLLRYLAKQAASNYPPVGDTITGTAKADSITNADAQKIINALAGNDTLRNSGDNVTIYGGAGNDYIYAFQNASNSKIFGDAGNDTLRAEAIGATISGGAGADYIYLYDTATNSRIDAGAGNDTIKTEASATSINGGDGNDRVELYDTSANSTIIAGKGNDTIYASSLGSVFQYSNGDGNDIIYDFSAKDTLKISGTSSTITSGNDKIVKVGSGSITLKGAASIGGGSQSSVGLNITNAKASTLISGTSHADTIKTTASKVTVFGGEGNDYIYAFSKASNAKFYGGNGNDTLRAEAGAAYISGDDGADYIYFYDTAKKSTATGGAGNDTIKTEAVSNSISGGDGNDYIYLFDTAKSSKVDGGSGNDSIYSAATSVSLTGGAGNDLFVYEKGSATITDYTAGADTIKIYSGTISKISYSGSNVTFGIGSGSLTVKNGKGKKITITDAQNKTTTKTYSGAVTGSSSLWIDDNFISDENNLDSISKISADYSTGDFSATEIKTLAQENNLVTYSKN